VLLDRTDFAPWLTGQAGVELHLAVDAVLRMWPVSRRVNRPGGGDHPALIEQVEVSAPVN
jgi:hypothetical protein